jgi:hypothetical protein
MRTKKFCAAHPDAPPPASALMNDNKSQRVKTMSKLYTFSAAAKAAALTAAIVVFTPVAFSALALAARIVA